MKAMYQPLQAGSDDLLTGSGPLSDSFALNLPVVFLFDATNGKFNQTRHVTVLPAATIIVNKK